MKVKIVNKNKFIKLPIILLGLLFILILMFTTKASSNTEMTYKTVYVSQGDTLWDIAVKETSINPYYKDYDIRDVVQNIKECNELGNISLSIGEELKIPSL